MRAAETGLCVEGDDTVVVTKPSTRMLLMSTCGSLRKIGEKREAVQMTTLMSMATWLGSTFMSLT